MSKLWVKFKTNNATQVSTQECFNVDDFIKAVKKELQIPNPPQELSLSTAAEGPLLQPDDPIPAQNTAQTPLFISIADVSTQGIVGSLT